MTIVRRSEDAYVIFTKGAPDLLLADCTTIVEGGAVRVMTEADSRRSSTPQTPLRAACASWPWPTATSTRSRML
jgi:hypothetical protein